MRTTLEGTQRETVAAAAFKLNERGTHEIIGPVFHLQGRSCTAYLQFGVCSLIDVQSFVVEPSYRRHGVCREFTCEVIKVAQSDQRDAVRFINVINPNMEDFLIRLGFRLLNTADYILLNADFDSALIKAKGVGHRVETTNAV